MEGTAEARLAERDKQLSAIERLDRLGSSRTAADELQLLFPTTGPFVDVRFGLLLWPFCTNTERRVPEIYGESIKVFVYGTLKKGGRLHEHLHGTFLGRAAAPGWVLHKLDWYPCVTPGAGTVHGELYGINNLQKLDHVEGYPNLFNRRLSRVLLGEVEHEAWIYYRDSCDAPVIETGVWDVGRGDDT